MIYHYLRETPSYIKLFQSFLANPYINEQKGPSVCKVTILSNYNSLPLLFQTVRNFKSAVATILMEQPILKCSTYFKMFRDLQKVICFWTS